MKFLLPSSVILVLACAGASAQEISPQDPERETPAEETAAQTVETIPVKAEDAKDPVVDYESDLPEVIVTASKRRKSRRDIAGTVDVVSGETLEKISAQSLEDYVKLVPGVSMSRFAADRNVITIRGINSSIGFGFTALTVGTYVDDIPFQDLFVPITVPDLNPFDLERVEILKGPQGTLFGSGALAGAVRYILAKPTIDVWQAKLSATQSFSEFGGTDEIYGGMVNVPLGDSIALRVVGLTRNDPGHIDEVQRMAEDVNKIKQQTGRVLAAWQATDRLKISGLYFTQETDQADLGYGDSKTEFRRGKTPFPSPTTSSFSGANLSGTYDFDWGTLLSTSNLLNKKATSYFTLDSALGQDAFGFPFLEPAPDDPNGDRTVGAEDAPFVVQQTRGDGKVDGYTQELRLLSPETGDSPWEWLGGLAYLRYHAVRQGVTPLPVINATLDSQGSLPTGPVPTPIGPVTGVSDTRFVDAIDDSVATEKAIFGEVTRRFWTWLELTAGARYYQTHLVADTQSKGLTALALYQTTNQPQTIEIKEEDINPKYAIRLLFSDNVQLYALAAKGFQFGGVQLAPPSAALAAPTQAQGGFEFGAYKSSTLWNYELGLRTEWFDRRLLVDVTGFYLDWKDLQLTQGIGLDFRPIFPVRQNLFSAIRNVGGAKSEGLETAISINPLRGLTLTSSAAFIHAVTSEVFNDGSGTPVPPGTRLPGTPRFAAANTVSYVLPLNFFGAWNTGLTLTHTHTGSYENTLTGASTIAGGYDLLDFQLSLVKPDWKIVPEFNFSLNNLLDVRGVALASDVDGQRNPAYFLVPSRTAVVSLQIRY